MYYFFSLIVSILLLLPWIETTAYAANSPSNLVSVTPSLLELDLETDQPVAELIYQNKTNQTIELDLSAKNFVPIENGSQLSFLQGDSSQHYKYELASWISFENKSVVISPNSSQTVKAYIEKKELTPGGHYAAILAKILNNNGNETVKVQGVLTTLLFVRTNTGLESEEGSIQDIIPDREFLAFPKNVLLRFQNSGNTELTPHGTVEIKDMFGFQIAKGIINEDSSLTYPESIRQYTIPLKTTSSFFLPGIYTINVTTHFGKTNLVVTKSATFFSEGTIPLLLIGIALLIAAGIIFFVRKVI